MAPLLAATVWKIMIYEDGDILNGLPVWCGASDHRVPSFSDASTARVSVVVVNVGKNVSWVTLIFMVGPTATPPTSAGRPRWKARGRFRHISPPMLAPAIWLILMFRGMGGVQTVEQIDGMMRGGPGTTTETIAVHAYQRFFQELGCGSAINLLVLGCSAGVGRLFA